MLPTVAVVTAASVVLLSITKKTEIIRSVSFRTKEKKEMRMHISLL